MIKSFLIQVEFVFGVSEIANNIKHLAKTFDNSISVCFNTNKFYDNQYDYTISIENKYLGYFVQFIYSPILLGFLMNKTDKFFYVWSSGFLFKKNFEFYFLKKMNKKLIIMYCGNDIRSPLLSIRYTDNCGIDNYLNYFSPQEMILQEDRVKKEALLADKYADLVFNYELDQISHLKKKVLPFPYMYPKSKFNFSKDKFDNKKKITIVHAPSSPIIKGTQLVRSAIKKLENQGYDFNYIELIDKSNEEVLSILSESHIVLNQFYGYGHAIGLLGIEALANTNCLMMSIKETNSIWPSQKNSLNDVILNTKYWEIDEKLKFLLDNPKEIKRIACLGYEYALNYFETTKAKANYEKILAKELNK